MTTISGVGSNGLSGVGAKSGGGSVDEAQDRFMTLLITQMKNQDPMNPLDNAQVTSQMAQLSTVTGINKLNTTLDSLRADMGATQSMQAASMIGHAVLFPSSTVNLRDGSAGIAFDIATPADKVTVEIKGPSGDVLKTLKFDKPPAGMTAAVWDGKTDSGNDAPAGNYQFTVRAEVSGQKIDATALASDLVLSVSSTPTGAKLNVSGGQAVGLTDVKEIL